ncbi:TetR/AcrR family transcriptional regulator [Pseudomonas sp. URIL14HWK12:I6]|uniref:TetR/AcrR family transcriptional regulator n=1 Tax=Pseudomonas sp. URIL14HWK12:I6 TaxID=1283293 RepID=UPI0004ADB91A|nr:TetR/AcrR family transcriptional regulator [Pseudomonas sp. URIL14HWK12:I6]
MNVASQVFKCNGINATGVSEIMAAAGLTHGGFYRHFESKEQLVAEACAVSMEELVGAAEIAVDGGDETFLQHIQDFLSADYRDDRLGGCPLVAMGSELARADAETRRAASSGFEGLIELMAKRSRYKDPESAKADAIFTLSSMIGAVTMSRIVDDPELSDLILESTKARLLELSSGPKIKRAKAKAA